MANSNYFVICKTTKSDHRFDISECSTAELEKYLHQEYARHAVSRGTSHYPTLITHDWIPRLERGFHLLIRGIGSQKNLLDRLTQCLRSQSKDNHIFLFHGLTPVTSVEFVIEHIIKVCEVNCDKFDNSFDDCRQAIGASEKRIYIIIHSLEEFDKSSPKVCEFLFKLAQCCQPRVSLVASSDHINLAQVHARRSGTINWIYYNCPTYLSPFLERSSRSENTTGFDFNDRILHKDLRLYGLRDIYESLQIKSKILLWIILKYFTSQDNETRKTNKRKIPKRTLPIKTLYTAAFDAYLVRKTAELYPLLKEFSDHKIINPTVKNSDIELALPIDVASKFLEQTPSPQEKV